MFQNIIPIFAVQFYRNIMANHLSAFKRIRQNAKRREANRYIAKTTRNAVAKLWTNTNKKEAAELLPKVVSMLDKLGRRNIIHKNKASNLKSKLSKYVASL